MARIRTIKPEFWVDDQIVELDYATRLLFIGLWNFVDDEGYVEYKAKRIKMQIFPADSLDVSRMLTNLLEMGRLARFTSDQGDLLRVVNWDRHQKISHPSPTRFTGIQAGGSVNSPEPSGAFLISPDGSGLKGKERKGKEGKGTDLKASASSMLGPLFEQAWEHWPKKVEKKTAREKFFIAARKIDPQVLLEHVVQFGDAYAATTERQFVPALGVWLARERWTDDLPVGQQKQTKTDQALSILEMGRQLANDRQKAVGQ